MSATNPLDEKVTIGPVDKPFARLCQGCWTFGGQQWGGAEDAESMAAMEAAFECGLTHFDTAFHYGGGRSEALLGEFAKGRREQLFLASKVTVHEHEPNPQLMIDRVETSLERLGVDTIELYYIHWPIKDYDLRYMMEGLETLRARGRVGAVGVSNFSVEQMEQVSEVGTIDAHQMCYNALWRFPERDVVPWCRKHNVAIVTYSSIAQGVLTGKFPREPEFKEDDQRPQTVLFEPEVWPHVFDAVEEMKSVAGEAGRPLTHLAIQWVARQAGVTAVLVGARTADQVRRNVAAMQERIDDRFLDRITEIGDRALEHIPDVGNLFRFYP